MSESNWSVRMPWASMKTRRSLRRILNWPPTVLWAGILPPAIQLTMVSGDTRQYRAACPEDTASFGQPARVDFPLFRGCHINGPFVGSAGFGVFALTLIHLSASIVPNIYFLYFRSV